MKKRTSLLIENGIYILIWVIIFNIPLLGYYSDEGIEWDDVKRFWLSLLPFLILFVINNYLLIPFLLFKKRNIAYTVSILLIITLLFSAFPSLWYKDIPPRAERLSGMPAENRKPPHEFTGEPPRGPQAFGSEQARKHPLRPLPIRWAPMLNHWLMAILLVGSNIAVRLYSKFNRDARHLEDLERQTLKAELDYLKAQINPHFFMNTLNNIHALIDIDAEVAKDTIIELSKIMRYVIYEASKPVVPLEKEVEFLDNYISLMRIRYSDDVEITATYPPHVQDVFIPPLLLMVLIENAFKHGVSYNSKSYICSELLLEGDRLTYIVKNGLGNDSGDSDPGIGMDNLSKRLNLLYGEKYSLDIAATTNEYIVKLIIPVSV